MEEYISHEDYKAMMDAFKQGAPKGLLKEGLEKEGNAFTAGLARAKKGQAFKIGDKDVKDTSNYDAPVNEYQFDQMYPEDPGPFEESHEGNDQWYDAFSDALAQLPISDRARKLVDRALNHAEVTSTYGEMQPQEAAKEFVRDIVAMFKNKAEDEPEHDYEPDTDADYEEPRDDFDMAGSDFNDGEFWEAEVKKFQEIAGVGPQDDGPEDDDDEAREKRAHKAETDDEEAENAEREIDEEETGENTSLRMPAVAAKLVAQKHSADLKPLYDKYQAAKKDPDHKVGNAAWKEYENIAISWCGHEMLERGMKRIEVSNILSGRGYHEDFNWEFMTDLGKELGGEVSEGLNEGSDYGKIIPGLKARGIKYSMPEKEIIKAMAEVMEQEAGYTARETRYYLGYDEDFIPDLLQALKDSERDMEEGLHMPPLQATGPTVGVTEDQAPFGFSVLSPDERKQLKEYINSMKTIKKEIAGLLEKAGRTGKIMEGVEDDEAVPAARPAHYNEPTKTPKHNPSNLGGNRTGLVMTKAEMWENEEGEHERIESMLDTKLHDAFHKVTGMIMKDLMADGFDGGDIKNFLQHEIDEKAKEAINAQHDF